jgi:hypothetical protein
MHAQAHPHKHPEHDVLLSRISYLCRQRLSDAAESLCNHEYTIGKGTLYRLDICMGFESGIPLSLHIDDFRWVQVSRLGRQPLCRAPGGCTLLCVRAARGAASACARGAAAAILRGTRRPAAGGARAAACRSCAWLLPWPLEPVGTRQLTKRVRAWPALWAWNSPGSSGSLAETTEWGSAVVSLVFDAKRSTACDKRTTSPENRSPPPLNASQKGQSSW